MTTKSSIARLVAVAVIIMVAVTPVGLASAQAQSPAVVEEKPARVVPAALPVFSFELGRTTLKAGPALRMTYSVAATQRVDSKAVSQKLRFSIQEDGVKEVTDSAGQKTERQGSSSRYLTINTGKYKTIGQLQMLMKDIFRRFLAVGVTPGTELGKIGDARFGGEIHFVVESVEVLRCDYVPATAGETAFRFKRGDAQAFANILEAASGTTR